MVRTNLILVDEVDVDFNTVLNARNLAIAREQNLDMLTICSTCQGMLSRSNQILNKDESMKKRQIIYYLKLVNLMMVMKQLNIYSGFL